MNIGEYFIFNIHFVVTHMSAVRRRFFFLFLLFKTMYEFFLCYGCIHLVQFFLDFLCNIPPFKLSVHLFTSFIGSSHLSSPFWIYFITWFLVFFIQGFESLTMSKWCVLCLHHMLFVLLQQSFIDFSLSTECFPFGMSVGFYWDY